MKNVAFLLILISSMYPLHAQINCDMYKRRGDMVKYEACRKSETTKGLYQFSKSYQQIMDEVLEIDSTFADAYRKKSTAYLKSGDFVTWKYLIDRAVLYDSAGNLGYRGWCRYQFFRDYKGAIQDIETLENMVNYDIGMSVNGDYHLNIAKGLCYKALGDTAKAIEVIEKQLAVKGHFVGLYDYLHLGVLYYEIGEYPKAIESLKRQVEENNIAENQYYIALVYKQLGELEKAKKALFLAAERYAKKRMMFDPYTQPYDKVFLVDIERELKALE